MLTLSLLLAFFLALQALLAWLYVSEGRRLKQTRSIPLTPCAEIGAGDVGRKVAVYGRLQTSAPLTSPVSELPCGWINLRVYQKRKGARYETNYTILTDLRGAICEIVDDSGGRIRLGHLKSAEIVFDDMDNSRGGDFSEPNPDMEARMKRAYLKDLGDLDFNSKVSYREYSLQVDSMVYASGTVAQEDGVLTLTRSGDTKKEEVDGDSLLIADVHPDQLAKLQGCWRRSYAVLFVLFGIASAIMALGLLGKLQG